MSREKIVNKLQERHEGTKCYYTTCLQNACWDASCIVRSHVKDGVIVAFEPDNTVNPGAGREEVSEEALQRV